MQPVQVVGDTVLLEQAIANLVDNALSHASGRVAIILRREDHTAALTVDDDRPGIPPDQRDAVFERLSRLDAAGLGLAIVADIVRAHAGTVQAPDSALGDARLQVSLPAGPAG